MYRNWASRSGCRLPSVTLALAWVENPCPRKLPPRGLRAARVPGRGQLIRQVLHALGRPQKRRLRIPPGRILHQAQQRRHQARIGLGELLAPRARPAHPPRRGHLPGPELRRAVRHRLPRRPAQPGHRADPAVPGRPRHRPQRQPPRLLIQLRQQQPQLRPDKLQELRVHAHTSTLASDTPETHVIPECLHCRLSGTSSRLRTSDARPVNSASSAGLGSGA